MADWKWDTERKCFYRGELADQQWCLPENMPNIAYSAGRKSAFQEAIDIAREQVDMQVHDEARWIWEELKKAAKEPR